MPGRLQDVHILVGHERAFETGKKFHRDRLAADHKFHLVNAYLTIVQLVNSTHHASPAV